MIILISILLSFNAFAKSAFLITKPYYESVNKIYQISVNFDEVYPEATIVNEQLIMRGKPYANLRVDNLFFQTMWTTFGDNQSLAVVSALGENSVDLFGTNDKSCCKDNLRYLKNSNSILMSSGHKIQMFQLDPLTKYPIHRETKDALRSNFSVFETMDIEGQDYLLGFLPRYKAVAIYKVNGDSFEHLNTQSILFKKLNKTMVLKDNHFFIQEEDQLHLHKLNLKTNELDLIKSIPLSYDYQLKPHPNGNMFLALPDEMNDGLKLFDNNLNLISEYIGAQPDVYPRVIEFFDENYFVVPTYSYHETSYNLEFFKIGKNNEIINVFTTLQPFEAADFSNVHQGEIL